MANLSGNGVPTRKTVGTIGDIYTDTNTGTRYECVFAYKGPGYEEFECQWRKLKTESKHIVNAEPEQKQEEKPQSSPEPEKKQDPEVEEESPAPKRTDYSSYSNRKNQQVD